MSKRQLAQRRLITLSLIAIIAVGLYFIIGLGRISFVNSHAAEKTNLPWALRLKSIVTDNFDRYATGSIVGQGGWVNYANGSNFVVQNIQTARKINKVLHDSSVGDGVVTRAGNALADGQQTVYVRTNNRASWGAYSDGNAQVRVSKGPWASGAPNLAFAAVSFKSDGNVAYYDPIAGVYQNFGVYNDNQWTLLQIQWRSSDKTARYSINNGAWTNWYPFANQNSFTNFDNVGFDFDLPSGSGGVDFDNLQ